MSRRTLELNESLHAYLLETSLREPTALTRLRGETGRMTNPDLQVAPEQGQFLYLLAKLTGARRISPAACDNALPSPGPSPCSPKFC